MHLGSVVNDRPQWEIDGLCIACVQESRRELRRQLAENEAHGKFDVEETAFAIKRSKWKGPGDDEQRRQQQQQNGDDVGRNHSTQVVPPQRPSGSHEHAR